MVSVLYAKRQPNGDVVIFKDEDCTVQYAVFPAHYATKPTRRNKWITLNCACYRLVWK